MRLVKRALKLGRGVSEAEILFAGCLHYGHIGCDEPSIDRMVKYITAADNRYLILLGDVIDAINVSDGRFNPREVAAWVKTADLADLCAEQSRRAAKTLAAIPSDRILGLLEGNHPRKTRTLYYYDAHRTLAEGLGVEPLGESAFIRLEYTGRDRKAAEPLDIYVEHGSGGAGSPEAVLTKLKKQAQKHPGADLYVGSHHHKAGFATATTAGLNDSFGLVHREIPILTAGCHLSYYNEGVETYGELFHMPVPNLGPAKVVFYPWGKPGVSPKAGRLVYRFPWWG